MQYNRIYIAKNLYIRRPRAWGRRFALEPTNISRFPEKVRKLRVELKDWRNPRRRLQRGGWHLSAGGCSWILPGSGNKVDSTLSRTHDLVPRVSGSKGRRDNCGGSLCLKWLHESKQWLYFPESWKRYFLVSICNFKELYSKRMWRRRRLESPECMCVCLWLCVCVCECWAYMGRWSRVKILQLIAVAH